MAAGARPKARITQASAIRQAIENDILSGALKPGSPIDEEELAARFGVSRTPIREAMLQLQQGGLINKQPRRHPTVVKLDLPRLVHMYEAVSELEALCARYAATRINARERDELQDVHRLAGEALAAGNAAQLAEAEKRMGEALSAQPDDPALLMQRGYLHQRMGKPRLALEDFQAARATGAPRAARQRPSCSSSQRLRSSPPP